MKIHEKNGDLGKNELKEFPVFNVDDEDDVDIDDIDDDTDGEDDDEDDVIIINRNSIETGKIDLFYDEILGHFLANLLEIWTLGQWSKV